MLKSRWDSEASPLRPELRRKATNQVRDLIGDLGVLRRVLVADQRVDWQIILNQPDVSRPGVFQELGAGASLLGIVGIVLQLAFMSKGTKETLKLPNCTSNTGLRLGTSRQCFEWTGRAYLQTKKLPSPRRGTRWRGCIPTISSHPACFHSAIHCFKSLSQDIGSDNASVHASS